MPWWFFALFVLGFNFAIWGTIGMIRLAETCAARLTRKRRGTPAPRAANWVALPMRPGAASARQIVRKVSLSVDDVAVLIPAHNEAAVLGASLDAITKLVPVSNIHVVSDGSTDDTPEIARRAGVHVHETERNVGKAGALREAIDRFGLINRFQVVLLLDADTRIQPDYFTEALPLFGDPEVVAVAGCVRTARDRQLSLIGNILVGYRERIYAIGQRVLKFGQTYSRVNATHIVPGFASMYRSEVLARIDLNPPGLVIEDFNMTFEVYQKRLGKVAFTLSAVAVTQDPVRLRDYIKQTRRWALGLWQTVRRHPPQANLFTAMLAILLLEFITASTIFVILPLIAGILAIPDLAPSVLNWAPMADVHTAVAAHMNVTAVVFGVGAPDYVLTCLVAILHRRARLLFLGLFFPLVRVIDSAISLSALAVAWFARSNGTWKSPPRRAIETQPARLPVPASAPGATMPATRPESPLPPDYGRERGHAS
ncbi:MAG TPA: glycosyltransferase family 2 protein [Streptosporangiaceae bacterium]|nr:glycosyltransferase family 2 protein [Streptosporangiaceae bacterium]